MSYPVPHVFVSDCLGAPNGARSGWGGPCYKCRQEEDHPNHRVSTRDLTQPQPTPVQNARRAVQDLVIEDLRSRFAGRLDPAQGAFEAVDLELVAQDIERRKAQGVAKYGTVLQAFNGRDAVVDAYQEALDLCQYLRQAIDEGRWLHVSYANALRMALHLRRVIEEAPARDYEVAG